MRSGSSRVELLPGTEAAARLDMSVAAVFMAKSNVQKLLREEIHRLERNDSPALASELADPAPVGWKAATREVAPKPESRS